MSYQLVKEDKHAYTVRHPNGTHITVAKAGLSDQVIKKLKSMPGVQKLSDGGGVQGNDGTISINPSAPLNVPDALVNPDPGSQANSPTVQPANPAAIPPDQFGVDPEAWAQAMEQKAARDKNPLGLPAASSGPAPTPSAPSSPTPAQNLPGIFSKNPLDMMNQGYQNQVAGIQGAAGAASQAAKDQTKAYQSAIDLNQKISDQYQQHYAQLDKEAGQIRDAVLAGKIDPDRYYKNMSTGSKISTAIGLILSGIGSGLTHQPNQALGILQKQVDADIDAQKADMGKQQTLFSMNMQRYHNLQMAENATRIQINQGLQAQLGMAGARAGSAEAAARARMATGALQMQIAPTMQQQALLQQAQTLRGSTDPQANAMLIRLTVPEKQQEAAFKELAMAENHAKQTSTILSAFDQANNDNTLGNRALHAGYEPASVTRIKTAMMPYLKDAEGRINEQELERTDALIPAAGDSASKIAQKKLGLQQFLQEKASFPTLRAYGIKVPELFNATGGANIQERPAVRGNGR